MLLTQFWQPMDVLGMSIPIIVYAGIITAVGIPLYFLSNSQTSEIVS
jgi:hypothetical protein